MLERISNWKNEWNLSYVNVRSWASPSLWEQGIYKYLSRSVVPTRGTVHTRDAHGAAPLPSVNDPIIGSDQKA